MEARGAKRGRATTTEPKGARWRLEHESEDDKTVKNVEKKKQSLYFPIDMLAEMQREADRQERPLSWIMQQAWKLSRGRIMDYASVDEL